MSPRIPIEKVVEAYRSYEQLAAGLGFRVNKGAVRKHALQGTNYRGAMKSFFSQNYAERHRGHTAPAQVLKALDDLNAGLARVVRRKLNGAVPKAARHDPAKLAQSLVKIAESKRVVAADAVAQSEQAPFLKRTEMSVEQFHELLKGYAKGQTVARGKLVRCLYDALKARGEPMSMDAIEERLRANTKVRTVPTCFAEIISQLDSTYLTGLIPIEEMVGDAAPEEWLEACRQKLGFRSHNGMHKALAEATTLNYESIHKALTRPRPGQRIQKQVRDVLSEWQALVDKDEPLPVDTRYLGVPAEKVRTMASRMARACANRNQVYREAASLLGVKSAVVRRTHTHADDSRTYAADGVRNLTRFLEGHRDQVPRVSYLARPGTRKLATHLSYRANEALTQWHEDRENFALRRVYRALRLQLIMALKQHRTEADWAPLTTDDDGDGDELAL